MKILFASNNKNKLAEVRKIINICRNDVDLVSMEDMGITIDVIEDCETLEDNAIKKAKEIYEVASIPVISEDFGFFLEKYKEIAGVHSNRWLAGTEEERSKAVVELMKNDIGEYRNAYYKSVMCYYDGAKYILGEGYVRGRVALELRGKNGFAYDRILELPSGKTMSELSKEEKNEMSSRRLALEDLLKKLG